MLSTDANISGAILLNCKEFDKNLVFFNKKAGFKLKLIYPADSPRHAILIGYGLTIHLTKSDHDTDITIFLVSDDKEFILTENSSMQAPNGVRLEFKSNEINCSDELVMPPLQNNVVVQKLINKDDWVDGRAGMQYRDLIPNRLGGRFIASHIRIEEGGPVPDYVHYHHIRFQLIYCHKGWVKAVYEDQGEPFIMKAGDCVLQPPHIRHQVLECSDQFEVIEVGCPAEHKTLVDHEMILPTSKVRPDRDFNGQKFVFHKKDDTKNVTTIREDGFNARDIGILSATSGEVSVFALTYEKKIKFKSLTHQKEFLFYFILAGNLMIEIDNDVFELSEGDAFSIPASISYCFHELSNNIELLEISLPNISCH
ncbi:MAG: cupin domain-containing protein [Woeseiaceae bacterium]|nr:cupin domain-containing protein [Woeseiaceae bacterium]